MRKAGSGTTPFADAVERDFRPDSALARGLPGYVCREEQVKLAREIADCMEAGGRLLAEAETGTGKTLAYLIPALRSELRVLISTHTRALQDQLMFRDLPLVRRALGASRNVALIKGRANYLCPLRLERKMADASLDRHAKGLLARIADWARNSRDGDLSALPFDPFARGVGGMVTATSEQCLGGKCSHFEQCPLFLARRKAQEADIVICNHSLLLADAALKSGDFGEVLPPADCVIVDEAHAIPELACRHFGCQVGVNRLTSWFNDAQDLLREWGDEPGLRKVMEQGFRDVLKAWDEDALARVLERWRKLVTPMEKRRERNEEAARLADRALEIATDIEAVLSPPEGYVAWREGERHQLAPVESGPVLEARLWPQAEAFVLLSATLRISGRFDWMQQRLGMEDARCAWHPSPFDYGRQAMIYAPRGLPDPGAPDYEAMLFAEMEALIRASAGRAFALFTSTRMLRRIGPKLAEALPWPVLIQDESGSRDAILQQFREDTHSVLCGTRSFWEGVDVPGEALSLVVIDKVPFAPPDDHLLRARRKRCEEQGGNGFADVQLPEAIAVLRQGVGRLIRSNDDRGVIAILDSRIYRKGWGRAVAMNLPPAPKTEDIADVRRFFGRS